ncbi:MAG: hypothetical protein ACRD99_03960, partial [Nitrososphaera sp.]
SHRVNRFLEYAESFLVIVLVLFGIGGFSYHLFRDDGWIETVAGNLWDVSIQYPLIALPVIVAAVYLGRSWNDARIVHGRTTNLPDYVIYALMAAGAVFIGRFLWLGYF